MEWRHPEKSTQIFYQEKLNCEEMANTLAWQRFPQPPVSTYVEQTVNVGDNTVSRSDSSLDNDPNRWRRESYRREKLNECLFSKGWILEKKEK